MTRSMLLSFLVLAACAEAARYRINPELEHESDEKFFKTDYPDDHSPKSKLHFGHPYPKIQEDDVYDKDYVTDKNDDGGYWDAQMTYDKYKNKLWTQKQVMKEAQKKEAEEKEELQKAEKAEAEAEKVAEKVEKQVKDVKEKVEKEEAQVEKAEEEHLDVAKEEVKTDAEKLKDCEKNFEDAKAKLKVAEEKVAAQKKDHAEADKKHEEMKKEEVVAEKAEEEAEEKEKEEAEEHAAAKKTMEGHEKEVKDTEAKFKDAGAALRKFRRADSGGGVHRSGSQRLREPSLLAAIIFAGLGSLLVQNS